ncbi:MAG: cadC 7 [Candidatus Eremiobacteraeota bacterium]|nr:cadC 7 [Candidatus Eremiobacteraeota bacterium]
MRFDPFTVDVRSRTLLCHDVAVPLRPKTFALLEVLVRAAGRLVSRDELYESLWPDDIVSDQNLAQQVFLLRTTLGSHAPGRAYVTTEPGRGYRFVAPVTVDAAGPPCRTEVERLTLRGRFFWEKRTREGFAKAEELFERAIAVDAAHAPAHAGLADVHLLRAEYLLEHPAQAFERARAAARRALALDASAPQPAAALGDIAFYHDRDFGEAERWFATALAANPRYATALAYRAWCRIAVGEVDAAQDDVENALRDAPYDLSLHTALAVCDVFARRLEAALDRTEFVLDLDPSYHNALCYRATALSLSGRNADGLGVLRAHEATRTSQSGIALTAFCAIRGGERDIAHAAEKALAELARSGAFVSSFNAALPAAARFDGPAAARILGRAAGERDPWCVFALHHPLYDGVREDARFRAVLDRVRAPALAESRTG